MSIYEPCTHIQACVYIILCIFVWKRQREGWQERESVFHFLFLFLFWITPPCVTISIFPSIIERDDRHIWSRQMKAASDNRTSGPWHDLNEDEVTSRRLRVHTQARAQARKGRGAQARASVWLARADREWPCILKLSHTPRRTRAPAEVITDT